MSILKNIDQLILTESFTFAMPDAIAELNRQLIELNNKVRDYFKTPATLDYTKDGTPPKEVVDDIVKSLRVENIVNSTPEAFRERVREFFKTYDQDPNVIKLIELSETQPNQFLAILIASAAIFTALFAGGGVLFYKKIKQYKVTPAELNVAQQSLENAKTDKDKKEAVKKIADLGAKHLIFQKFNKE